MGRTYMRRRGARLAVVLAGLAITVPALAADEVNIYSYRETQLIGPLVDAFTAKTGINVNIVYAKEGLIERAAAEGANSPADLLLTNEFGLLIQAKEAGITSAVVSPELEAAIPAAYRDTGGEWFGLTRRARVVYASKSRVAQDTIGYAELADPKWRGKICSRSGQHSYNVSLFASVIAHEGLEKAEAWLKGVKENLAKKPSGGDRDQIKAIFAGECDLAIGNTYYMGAMLQNEKEPQQKEWAAAVKLIFPDAGGRGTHVNISGAAVLKHAPHREAAVKLVAYLASDEAQQMYTAFVNEYPINDRVPASAMVAGWGALKADPLPLAEIAKLRKAASELVDKVGFDDGPSS